MAKIKKTNSKRWRGPGITDGSIKWKSWSACYKVEHTSALRISSSTSQDKQNVSIDCVTVFVAILFMVARARGSPGIINGRMDM